MEKSAENCKLIEEKGTGTTDDSSKYCAYMTWQGSKLRYIIICIYIYTARICLYDTHDQLTELFKKCNNYNCFGAVVVVVASQPTSSRSTEAAISSIKMI